MIINYITLHYITLSSVTEASIHAETYFNKLLGSNGCLCDTSLTSIFWLLDIMSQYENKSSKENRYTQGKVKGNIPILIVVPMLN
jgi:hypothetical protein